MDKQIKSIKLLEDGRIRLKTGKVVKPCNKVYTLDIDNNLVEILVSRKFMTTIDADDYFENSFWAHTLEMGHADIRKGVVAFDNGFTHKSAAAQILHTEEGQKVGYRDGNKFNLRKSNLYIKGKED
jgi:hypothetical protein